MSTLNRKRYPGTSGSKNRNSNKNWLCSTHCSADPMATSLFFLHFLARLKVPFTKNILVPSQNNHGEHTTQVPYSEALPTGCQCVCSPLSVRASEYTRVSVGCLCVQGENCGSLCGWVSVCAGRVWVEKSWGVLLYAWNLSVCLSLYICTCLCFFVSASIKHAFYKSYDKFHCKFLPFYKTLKWFYSLSTLRFHKREAK